MAQEIVHRREIKVDLSGIRRLEFSRLQIDHDITTQFQMVKKQIDVEIVAADLQMILLSDESKSCPHLKQKFGDMLHKGIFNLPLLRFLADREEIKHIWVF